MGKVQSLTSSRVSVLARIQRRRAVHTGVSWGFHRDAEHATNTRQQQRELPYTRRRTCHFTVDGWDAFLIHLLWPSGSSENTEPRIDPGREHSNHGGVNAPGLEAHERKGDISQGPGFRVQSLHCAEVLVTDSEYTPARGRLTSQYD